MLVHASTVAFDGRGVLILGPSGTGKSALALQLMAFGADLVSDDQTEVHREGPTLTASAPPDLAGLIEARGVGILMATPVGPVPLALAIDLALTETERLPPFRNRDLLGCTLPLLHNLPSSHFPVAIVQYMKSGRRA